MGLALTALISWLFVLPLHLRGHVDNPYIGIVVFLIIPVVLVAGLAMIRQGVFLARRRARLRLTEHVVDRKVAVRAIRRIPRRRRPSSTHRRTQATYRAARAHGDRPVLRRQTCHVMTPEFRSHRGFAARSVSCVDCHVGKGRAAGSRARSPAPTARRSDRRLLPRPIPSAIESAALVPARETCETCTGLKKFVSARLR